MESLKELGTLMKIGYRLFYGDCSSVKHTLDRIIEYAPKTHSIFVWWRNQLSCIRYSKKGVPDNASKARFNMLSSEEVKPIQLLNNIRMTADEKMLETRGLPEKSIVILMHGDEDLNDPAVKTMIGYLTSCPNYANKGMHLFFYSDRPIVHPFLHQHGMELRVPPLSEEEIVEFIKQRIESSGLKGEKRLFLNQKEVFDELVKDSNGLTPEDIDSIIDWGFVLHRFESDPTVFKNRVAEIQAKKIENSDVLSFMPDDEALNEEDIGGFDAFMEDMRETKYGLSDEAKATGLGTPKGVVLVGFPGTGKTMASRIMGKVLGLRTIRFDVASVFGAYLGESEVRMKAALRLIDDYGKCLVYIDDADKVLSGANGGGNESASSTIKRVLGMLFTWLNDNKTGAYVVLTMNNKEDMPIELFRSGRFDKVYFVGLPTRDARKYILERNFEKIDLKLSQKEWDELLMETKLYTGAELVQMVKEAMWYSLYHRGSTKPTLEELLLKAKKGNHLVESNPLAIVKIRSSWGSFLSPVDSNVNYEELGFINEWKQSH